MATQKRLQPLDRATCLALLGRGQVARVAFVVPGPHGAGPEVELLPVAYTVVGEDLLLRTSRGSRLAATAGGRVTVEVDDVGGPARTGWSVVVTGPVTLETAPDSLDQLGERLPAWAPGARDLLLRVRTERISGRHLGGRDPDEPSVDVSGPAAVLDLRHHSDPDDDPEPAGRRSAWPARRRGDSSATWAESPFDGR